MSAKIKVPTPRSSSNVASNLSGPIGLSMRSPGIRDAVNRLMNPITFKAYLFVSCLLMIHVFIPANCGQETENNQNETQVIIPLGDRPAADIQAAFANYELIELEKEKLRLEIEYLKRKLARLDFDELRELEIERNRLQINAFRRPSDPGTSLSASNSEVDGSTAELTVQIKPSTDDQPSTEIRPETNGRRGVKILVVELRDEQARIRETAKILTDYAEVLDNELNQLTIKRQATQSELAFLRTEQQKTPNTRTQNQINQLTDRYQEFDETFQDVTTELTSVNESLAKLLLDEGLIGETVMQLERLDSNLKSMQEFRRHVEELLQ